MTSYLLTDGIVVLSLSRVKCLVNVTYNDGGGIPCYQNIIIPTPVVMRLHKKVQVY